MSDEHQSHLCEACQREEFREWVHPLIHESSDKNDRWFEKFRINDWPRWDYSLEDCTLTFSRDGRAQVVCEIRAIGSVQGNSWEWSWGNENLPDTCKEEMLKVRDFGIEKGWAQLSSLFLENDEFLGWELASAASHLLSAEAVYRCPYPKAPGSFMYLAILRSQYSA